MPEDNVTNTTTTENKSSFSLEYVQELRGENASYRTRAKDAETRAKEAEMRAQQNAEAQVAEANRAAQARIIRAELRAEALKAGLLDADDLKLADVSQLNVNEDGEVSGVIELVKALKQAKPYLFSRNANTSQAAPVPGKTTVKSFDARQATPEELAADAKARGLHIKLR
jgi:hypothetical protein